MNNAIQFKRYFVKVFVCFLLVSVIGLAQRGYGQENNDEGKRAANIPHAEDYESDEYMSSLKQTLDRKLNHSYKESKDWALIGFVIDYKGKISQAWVCNSSGNEELDEETLASLKRTKLPTLEEGSPAAVKAFYQVNAEEAQKADLKERHRTAGLKAHKIGGLQELLKDSKDPKAAETMGFAILIMFAILFAHIYQVFFGFFLAGIYWWFHRLFLGRFPA